MLPYSENAIYPTEVGHFSPDYVKDPILTEGHIGYVVNTQTVLLFALSMLFMKAIAWFTLTQTPV
jgi:hypothetical protein